MDDFSGSNSTGCCSYAYYLIESLNLDIDYLRWLGWMFTPVLVMFVLPAFILVFLYLSALFLYIHKWHRHRLLNAFETDFWDGARKALGALWDAQGWFWHGYEVEGLENIPKTGPALIVFYHGALPIDTYYLMAKYILLQGRLIHCVGDRFLFKVPGWSILLEAFKVIPGTVESCANILKNGDLLAIAPGGVYEAQFGNSNYEIMWKSRVGFAKVALEAKAPIIPMFTKNVRESFRTVSWGIKFWHWLYKKTHLPLVPLYGFFPVKLKTYIGKPIMIDSTRTPEEISEEASNAIKNLIREHQRVPGSIFHAMLDRFSKPKSLTKEA